MTDVLDTVAGKSGELVLRRAGNDFEVIANGVFLMDTRNGESERLLVSVAADLVPGKARMLIGGLGVGYSLRAALDHPGVGEIVVVEREAAVIGWNREGPLKDVHDDALSDERVTVVEADLVKWLRRTEERFDALCLDIDNGPEWTVTDGNAKLYRSDGLDMLAARLRPGGVLAVWSAESAPSFARRLRARFSEVRELKIPVPQGEPDVLWFARA
ncbi:spermidine synthase [Amycolatopsis sp. BJA-103]|uniref:spermine/spermidine synthase domain-containing protein n=1 Tax=unclassified Amycolatopsis TaxID=2618356 RepID=UPI000C7669F6|nr:spermidine synthase [Amycolatopsis sp. BJA-103]AUI63416.1 spermidine synthase [Amycolatopsis sp. BJA-103]PNE19263.1 spermidine synthase [Amycolatopsis sp. BJA-103]